MFSRRRLFFSLGDLTVWEVAGVVAFGEDVPLGSPGLLIKWSTRPHEVAVSDGEKPGGLSIENGFDISIVVSLSNKELEKLGIPQLVHIVSYLPLQISYLPLQIISAV